MTKSPLGRAPTAKRFGENAAAALLLACTVVAILWANSPWSETYSQFWGTPVGLSFGDLHVELTVKEIVNDGLMAFFFFIVGLRSSAVHHWRADRAVTCGRPGDRGDRRADVARGDLPVVQPVRGRCARLGCGDLDRHRVPGRRAGDHRPKYPARLRTFLLTLAVVDDIGALIAIAVFYSERIRVVPLLVAVGLLFTLLAVRYLPAGGRGPAYSVLGVGLWLSLFAGGCTPRWREWRWRC